MTLMSQSKSLGEAHTALDAAGTRDRGRQRGGCHDSIASRAMALSRRANRKCRSAWPPGKFPSKW